MKKGIVSEEEMERALTSKSPYAKLARSLVQGFEAEVLDLENQAAAAQQDAKAHENRAKVLNDAMCRVENLTAKLLRGLSSDPPKPDREDYATESAFAEALGQWREECSRYWSQESDELTVGRIAETIRVAAPVHHEEVASWGDDGRLVSLDSYKAPRR